MKIKLDFITNSSSTAFMIKNISNKKLNLTDFVLENLFLLNDWLIIYDWYAGDKRYTPVRLLESAADNNIIFPPKQARRCVFGDEDGTIIGHVYDYMLRDGGKSKSFTWQFHEHLR